MQVSFGAFQVSKNKIKILKFKLFKEADTITIQMVITIRMEIRVITTTATMVMAVMVIVIQTLATDINEETSEISRMDLVNAIMPCLNLTMMRTAADQAKTVQE